MTLTDEWNAIIVAGGRASRLGGIDKTALVYQGKTLLEHAIDGVGLAGQIVVVGPDDASDRFPWVRFVREEPRFGGPAAAVVTALEALRARGTYTAVIAGDLPNVADAFPALWLVHEVVDGDGVIAVDEEHHRQPLLAIYRTSSLRAAAEAAQKKGVIDGLSMRQLIKSLNLTEVPLANDLCRDVDTELDAAQLGINLVQPLSPAG